MSGEDVIVVAQNNVNGNSVSVVQAEDDRPYFPVRNYQKNGNVVSWHPSVQGTYGWRRNGGARAHAGSDIYTVEGENVHAVKDGTIITGESFQTPSAGWGEACVITVDHGDILVRYCEVSDVIRLSGRVNKGDVIAKVKRTRWVNRRTGAVTRPRPMLHLEIYTKTETGALYRGVSESIQVPIYEPGITSPRRSAPTNRRRDAVNPGPYLDQWINNLPPER